MFACCVMCQWVGLRVAYIHEHIYVYVMLLLIYTCKSFRAIVFIIRLYRVQLLLLLACLPPRLLSVSVFV